MAENSKIEWTHHTFSEAYWKQPLRWNREATAAGERRRVFCSSLADVFEDRPELIEPRQRLFRLIQDTPNLDWLLLSKRPENVLNLIRLAIKTIDKAVLTGYNSPYETSSKRKGNLRNLQLSNLEASSLASLREWLSNWLDGQPPSNVWLGTSVENQEQADKRIPELLKIPATVRFLSCEPLLGPVSLRSIPLRDGGTLNALKGIDVRYQCHYAGKIDWVICGGESGPDARPMRTEWARSLARQCETATVPFFFKQWGEYSHYDQICRWEAGTGIISRASFWKKPDWFDEQKIPGVWVTPDGKTHKRTDNDDADFYYRVGKKAAGRLLDGREWSQFPY